MGRAGDAEYCTELCAKCLDLSSNLAAAVCYLFVFSRVGYPTLYVVGAVNNFLLHAFGFEHTVVGSNNGHKVCVVFVAVNANKGVGKALAVQILYAANGSLLIFVAAHNNVVSFVEFAGLGGL